MTRFAERDRIEGESIEFHQRVRAEFRRLAASDPDHYLVLDARAPVEEIARDVLPASRHCSSGRADDRLRRPGRPAAPWSSASSVRSPAT